MRKEAAHQDVVISVKGLCNRFGSHEVHTDLNLDLYHREILGVVGGSGTGKSVLLKCILGLEAPDAVFLLRRVRQREEVREAPRDVS